MIKGCQFNDGDKIFLFSEFPYDFEKFPLSISRGIDLVWRPYISSFDSDDDRSLYSYLLPEQVLIKFGVNPPLACIRIAANIKNKDRLFFQFMLALRLVKAIPIKISGSFVYSQDEHCHILSPDLLCTSTTINNGAGHVSEVYTADDISFAVKIFKKINKFQKSSKPFSRMAMAIQSFTDINFSGTTSYSMVYQELFTCLACLFASVDKYDVLALLVGGFLGDMGGFKSKKIEVWIGNAYAKKRNMISHGNPLFWCSRYGRMQLSISLQRYRALLKLYGIVRLCFLGFLGMSEEVLKICFQKSSNKAVEALKSKKASRLFLKDFKIRTDCPYTNAKKISAQKRAQNKIRARISEPLIK